MAKQTVPFVVEAEGTGVAQTVTALGDDPHTFRADTLPAFGGADAEPSPLSYALGALTSCHQVTGSLVAKSLGLTLGRWQLRAQGDLDPSVISTGAQGNANFDAVTVEVTLETDATPEQLERLQSETERRCPVTQLFQRSGLAFTSTWSAVPLTA